MTALFSDHRDAARALFNGAELKPREGQFVGGLAFDNTPLTEKQANWLAILLKRHGLPEMIGGAS